LVEADSLYPALESIARKVEMLGWNGRTGKKALEIRAYDPCHMVLINKGEKQMKEKQANQIGQEIKYNLTGWILFIICAIFYIASSLKNYDTLTFIGSVIFLIACIVFLIPMVGSIKKAKNDTKMHTDKTIL